MSAVATFYAPGGTSSYAAEVTAVTRLLTRRKLRVLAVDWDLAPRLARGLIRHPDASQPGFLDLLLARMEEKPGLDWRGLRVRYDEAPGADLLPAGGASWSASDFLWSSFYETHGGGAYLERLRDEWSASYDVVLIHCPAGSDEEGVCTVQMADVLALVFELGRPGAAQAVHSVRRRQEARQQLAYDRMPLQILPIPVVTGADPREEDLRLHEAALWLAPCLSDWLPGSLSPRDALESLRFDAEPGRNERSCLLVSKLIRCDFQDAAKLLPLPAKPEQPFENAIEKLARAPLSYILESDLSALSKLAATLHTLGDDPGARQLQEMVLEKRLRVLGEEHPDTLSAMAGLAATLHAQGDSVRARQLQVTVLEGRLWVLGQEHPDTLSAMASLAATLHALGDYPGARQLQEKVLEVHRRVLGEQHPDTLSAMTGLAATLHALSARQREEEVLEKLILELLEPSEDDYPGARQIQEEVLEVRRRVLGPEHPDTLSVMARLAATRHAQGDYAGARQLQETLLEVSRQVLGPEHPDTLSVMTSLATTLHALSARQREEEVLEMLILDLLDPSQGDSLDARRLQETVLEVSRRVLDPEHPDTLSAMARLAATLHVQGDYAGARQFQEKVLEVLRRVLGPEHPDTLSAMGSLAAILYSEGDYEGARQLQETVLELSRQVLGEEHPDTLWAIRNLVATLRALGDHPSTHQLKKWVLAAQLLIELDLE